MVTNIISTSISLVSWNLEGLLQLLLDPLGLFLFIFYTISLLINWLIYSLAATTYTLFPAMCNLTFSKLGEDIQLIVNRIEIFIGIFMLFIVAFNMLKYMVDPDKKESATSKLVVKIVISLVLLVSSSFIFGILDELQMALVNKNQDNIAQKIVFGDSGETTKEDDLTRGKRIVYAVFFNMYQNQRIETDSKNNVEYGKILEGESFFGVVLGNLWSDPQGYKSILYQYPFLAEVFGLFLILLFGTFTIDIGVRNFTLLFLRILFPIAAIGYITPKGDQLLGKYISSYISAYVEIFIKTFLIYFILYIFLWFMARLTVEAELKELLGESESVVGSVPARMLLLLLILVSLFMFFTKGVPAIMEKVFGIKMDSSLMGTFGKALGLAAAGASLVTGGLAGGIAAKASGAGAKGVASAMAKGAARGASAGWNLGKNVGAGKIGQGFVGYGKGMAGTAGAIKKNINDSVEKLKHDADEAQSKYDNLNKDYAKEKGILDSMGQDNPNRSAQEAKVNQLEGQVQEAKEVAKKKSKAAQKADPSYQPKAVKNAIDADNNYNNKVTEVSDAQKDVEHFENVKAQASNDLKVKTQAAEDARVEAERLNAKDPTSQEAKAATANAVNAEAVRKMAEQNYSVAESNLVSANKKLSDATSARDAALNKAQTTAKEAKEWDPSFTSPHLVENGTGQQQTTVTSGQTVTQQQSTSSMNTQNSGQSTVVGSTPGAPSNPSNNESATANADRKAASEYSQDKDKADNNLHSENIQHLRSEVGGTIKAEPSSHNETNVNDQTTNTGVNGKVASDNSKNSGYVGRKDVDREAINAENERLRNTKVEEIREEFGTGIVSMDEDDNDDSNSDIFEVLPNEEETIVQDKDDELETVMENDIRAYGERASRRFRELADVYRMDANVAMQKANQEAHDAIKSIAKDLIKEGKNVPDAYEEARRIYNEG